MTYLSDHALVTLSLPTDPPPPCLPAPLPPWLPCGDDAVQVWREWEKEREN